MAYSLFFIHPKNSYDNKDQGGHYHKATGSVIKVRGRYGSRNAATGKIDETVYTAGARG